MRIDTSSGLHGSLIEYRSDFARGERPIADEVGIALVLRDDAPLGHRPYSTHRIYRVRDEWFAEAGNYDMTLAEAEADFERRARERVTADAA